MRIRIREFVLVVFVTVAGCKGCSCTPKITEVHLLPGYGCTGEGASAAVWNTQAGVGEVRMITASGEPVCTASILQKYCLFSRTLGANDSPVRAEVHYKGDVTDNHSASFTILSGPHETQDYLGELDQASQKDVLVRVHNPIYGRCAEGPNGEPKTADEVCDPPGSENCTCPDEGRVVEVQYHDESISVPSPKFFIWNLSGYFSPSVETRVVKYQSGEALSLAFSGPGLTGSSTLQQGQAVGGNNGNPSGVWLGAIPEGVHISYREDKPGEIVATTPHKLRFTIACDEP